MRSRQFDRDAVQVIAQIHFPQISQIKDADLRRLSLDCINLRISAGDAFARSNWPHRFCRPTRPLTDLVNLLAGVFFLRAYKPNDGPPSMVENKSDLPTGTFGLLGATVGPKVLGISCAVMLIGILFWFLNMTGAMEMLRIGCTTALISALLMGIFILSKPAWSATLMPLLYRALPVWIVGVYLFMSKPA